MVWVGTASKNASQRARRQRTQPRARQKRSSSPGRGEAASPLFNPQRKKKKVANSQPSMIIFQQMSQAIGKPKRQYSDSFKAQALIALELNEGNVQRTANELGIPLPTLANWRDNRCGIHAETLQMKDALKEPVADLFERNARIFLEEAVNPDKVKGTSAYYAQIAASDAIKSAQLLRGQPTAISGSIMSDDERRLRLFELLQEGKAAAEAARALAERDAEDPPESP